MTEKISVQHKIYLRALAIIILIYLLSVCLGFYFAENKQYLMFLLTVIVIIGNVYFGRYFSVKLNQVIVISEYGIKLTIPEVINIIKIKIISVNLRWEEIQQVILLSKESGPIIIKTTRGDFNFWHPFDNKVNFRIIELLNSKIRQK